MANKTVRFIDLFAGMGGIRIGFEQAFDAAGFKTECVLTSEIKESAVRALKKFFPGEKVEGDITKIKTEDIPDFDFLLGGFPCQAFSVAGKQRGFADTRGTLFFEIERILRDKKPYGFLLENVEGLVVHDLEHNTVKPGRTLKVILQKLREELGYKVTWEVLDAQNYGLAQARRRVYIVGTRNDEISLDDFVESKIPFGEIMEKDKPHLTGPFIKKLFKKYKPADLYGKAIKDKRGCENNIHSWDIGVKGAVTKEQRALLNVLLLERRKRHWAKDIGIDWMDGMPLTAKQIRTFHDIEGLDTMLDKLVEQGYLVKEHPKKRVLIESDSDNTPRYERVQDITKPKGYNIVAGKLSFVFSKILDPAAVTPTLVAMDMSTIGVVDGEGIRKLTVREGLRLFGYPDNYTLEFLEKNEGAKGKKQAFDLLGNTVCVPVIRLVSERLATSYKGKMNGGKK